MTTGNDSTMLSDTRSKGVWTICSCLRSYVTSWKLPLTIYVIGFAVLFTGIFTRNLIYIIVGGSILATAIPICAIILAPCKRCVNTEGATHQNERINRPLDNQSATNPGYSMSENEINRGTTNIARDRHEHGCTINSSATLPTEDDVDIVPPPPYDEITGPGPIREHFIHVLPSYDESTHSITEHSILPSYDDVIASRGVSEENDPRSQSEAGSRLQSELS